MQTDTLQRPRTRYPELFGIIDTVLLSGPKNSAEIAEVLKDDPNYSRAQIIGAISNASNPKQQCSIRYGPTRYIREVPRRDARVSLNVEFESRIPAYAFSQSVKEAISSRDPVAPTLASENSIQETLCRVKRDLDGIDDRIAEYQAKLDELRSDRLPLATEWQGYERIFNSIK